MADPCSKLLITRKTGNTDKKKAMNIETGLQAVVMVAGSGNTHHHGDYTRTWEQRNQSQGFQAVWSIMLIQPAGFGTVP